MKRIFKNENQSEKDLDALFMHSVLGIMIGARLGHVIFYQPELLQKTSLAFSYHLVSKAVCTLQISRTS